MFDQHNLWSDWTYEEDQGKSALILAHELVHNMGVAHDGEGGSEDCDGEYHRRHVLKKYTGKCGNFEKNRWWGSTQIQLLL